MTNPWLKKNPFMSMWLSGANSAANSARGRLTAQAKRQSAAAITQATKDVFGIWAEAMTAPARPARKKKR